MSRPRSSKAVTTALFILLAVAFAALVSPRAIQVQKLKQRSEDLEKELTRLKKENAYYEQELRLLKDDPVYLEKVARAKFNKAKEGEIVYRVVHEE